MTAPHNQCQPMTAQAIAHELFANQCFAFTGEGRSHSPQCQHAAQRLEEWHISSHASLRSQVSELRDALEAIKKATIEGRVCDDVAWFDQITTLHDFCDLVLNPSDPYAVNSQHSDGEAG